MQGRDNYIGKVDKLQKQIDDLTEKVNKKYQVDDINCSVKETEVMSLELKTQFRCNGSDNYLDWLDSIIYHDKNYVCRSGIPFGGEYSFEVCDTPEELEKRIRSRDMPDRKQVARIVAGYCWKWSDKLESNGDLYRDVKIGDWSMPWETNNIQARKPFNKLYAPSADLWASHPMGINQVGCIFSAQGFEVDYIGVILGPDIMYDDEQGCIRAVKGKTHSVLDSDPEFDTHVNHPQTEDLWAS